MRVFARSLGGVWPHQIARVWPNQKGVCRYRSPMVMDRELALLNAVNEVFPWCHRQLCTWHIEKNVLVHAAKSFDDEESRNEFMRSWTEIMTSKSKDIYKRRLDAFRKNYGRNYALLLEYI